VSSDLTLGIGFVFTLLIFALRFVLYDFKFAGPLAAAATVKIFVAATTV